MMTLTTNLTQITVNSGNTKAVLIFGFSSVGILLLIIASIGLNSMSIMSDKLSQIINDNNIRSQHAFEMRSSARERTMILHQMARTNDIFKRDELFIKLREHGEEFLRARQKIIDLGLNHETRKILDMQKMFSTIAGPLQYEVIDLLNNEKTDEAMNSLVEKVIPIQDKAIELIDKFIGLQQQYNNNSLELTHEEFEKSFQLIIALTITGVILGLIIFGTIFRRTNIIFQALYDSRLHEKTIRENIVDAVVTCNQDGFIESSNKAIKAIFGIDPTEIIGNNIDSLIPVDHTSSHKINSITSLAKLHKQQITTHTKYGKEIVLQVGINKVLIKSKPLFVIILIDITEQTKSQKLLRELNEKLESRVEERTRELQQANEKLKYLANHDTITDLPNRSLLNEHLNHILASANRLNHKVALLFLDIDEFKQVNDTFGHQTGDILLKQIGDRLTDTLRQSDLVSRVGGDEFIIVLDDISSKDSLEAIAHKLIEIIKEPFNIKNNICHIGVSIGISIYPEDGADIETLIRCADQAMYRIKGSGKNDLYFYNKRSLQ